MRPLNHSEFFLYIACNTILQILLDTICVDETISREPFVTKNFFFLEFSQPMRNWLEECLTNLSAEKFCFGFHNGSHIQGAEDKLGQFLDQGI